MKITDVKIQAHNKNRVSVFVDGEYLFSVGDTDAVRLGIKKGREITNEDIAIFNEEGVRSKAKEAAVDLISRKAVTKKTLIDFLLKKGYEKELCQEISDEFALLGYIDDYAFAKSYAQDAFEYKKHGKTRIENDLRKKGVSFDVIKDALSDVDFDYEKNIEEIIKIKFGNADFSDYKVKSKVIRYFAYRGYSISEITSAIDKMK